MRLASFNVENLFSRAKALNQDTWAEGKPVLEDYARLTTLLGEAVYTSAMKTEMVTLLQNLGLAKADTGPFVILRRNRGSLVKRARDGTLTIVANGRADWVGSLELLDSPVNETAMLNTARVMHELGADVLGVVEVESRPTLNSFNQSILPAVGGVPYDHAMVIDGNDERGIDVGLLTRKDFPLDRMRSHVDDRQANGGLIFSRDCPEYEVITPSGNRLIVLVNHFKSKGFGSQSSSNQRRKLQADRVAAIYQSLLDMGLTHIAVIGDLNDTPDSAPLASLFSQTNLQDISTHTNFEDGGFVGTHGSAGPDSKIDYILLSPALFAKTTGGGVFRKGVWPGVRPRKWPVFETLTKPVEAASDHAAIWADIDI